MKALCWHGIGDVRVDTVPGERKGDGGNTVRNEICARNTFEIAAPSQSTGTQFALLKNHFQNLSTWQKALEWLVRNAIRFESRMPQG